MSAWAIDMDTIKTQRNSGDVIVSRNVEVANKIAPAVLTCIPGIIPVVVPIRIPIKQAITKSNINITLFALFLFFVQIIL